MSNKNMAAWAAVLAMLAGALAGSGCCRQLGPVVVNADLRRDDVARVLGSPTFDEVTTVADILEKKLIGDAALAGRLKAREPHTRVELAKWEAECWRGDGDYFMGLFDPATGQVLTDDGGVLTAGRTRMN